MREHLFVVDGGRLLTSRCLIRSLLVTSALGSTLMAVSPAQAQSCPSLPPPVTTANTIAAANGTQSTTGQGLSLIRCSSSDGATSVALTSAGADGANGSTHHIFGTAQGGGNGKAGGAITIGNLSGSPLANSNVGTTILAISRGGNGGAGGDTEVAGSGGTGGLGGNGGSVGVVNGDQVTSQSLNSTALVAQSIGGQSGPGGTGGIIIGSGGSAAGAGNGGQAVTVVNLQSGLLAAYGGGGGISAVSLGGTGGEGGASRGLFYAHGGNGARGGDAGQVDVFNAGTIKSNYAGITALSVGGGGGDGGGAVAVGAFGGVAIGGYGGAGGNGGAVWVHQVGKIETYNIDGAGVKAASIAGGGGSGATGSTITLGVGGNFALAMGGSGGVGGSASSAEIDQEQGSAVRTGVTADSNGNPIFPWGIPQGTSLDFSPGLLAQSIGGGGGSGGQALSVSTSLPLEGISLAVGVSLGGAGAQGGGASTAKIVSQGTIDTGWGRFSPAIVAQSIGGGGGNGGNALSVDSTVNLIGSEANSASVGVSLAGNGGNGGTSGLATVKMTGQSMSRGDMSGGILAQSVAGGGGNGGHSFDVASAIGGNAAAISVSMGGNGGTGGTAGAATVEMVTGSKVTTLGNLSSGLVSQSIAGGGGNGGTAHSYAVALQGGSGRALAANVGIGGSGGIGGQGNAASASVSGAIQTYGSLSAGALVQSIGGGGGNGGHALALTGALSLDSGSFGSKGQAIAASVVLGGSGGAGSTGGSATFDLTNGTINTVGLLSAGVAVQSIGGGGGHGGTAQSFSVASGIPTDLSGGFNRSLDSLVGSVKEQYSASPNLNASLVMGGSGGSGGLGGAVEVSLSGGSVATTGAMSDAILAQSLGGGGGAGGNAIDDGFAGVGAYTLSLNVGGGAGQGQSGGAVTVENSVDHSQSTQVSTGGLQSYGVLAQSIGGGGGKGGSAHTAFTSIIGVSGTTVTATIGGKGGSGSSGGQVTVGDLQVATSGIQGNGIVAQSIGGGGGNGNVSQASGAFGLSFGSGGGSGSNGGSVFVRNATIQTQGAQGIGILAQSIGGGGGLAGLGESGSKTPNLAPIVTKEIQALNFAVNGGGGSGGDVRIGCALPTDANCGVTVMTSGNQAAGIVAQSFGGGGGTSQSAQMKTAAKTINLDQSRVTQIGSGTVYITDNQNTLINVSTLGDNAIGILAQSFDNGGGAHWVDGAVPTVTQSFGSLWSSANGGVLADLYGRISTYGANSHGLVLQALSNAATVQTNSGLTTYGGAMLDAATVAVTLENGASIATYGTGAAGILTRTNGNTAAPLTLAQFQTPYVATKTRAQDIVIAGGASVSTSGANSWAIDMYNGPWAITQPVSQINTHLLLAQYASVQSTGANSGGIRVIDSGNAVIEILGNVSATGEAVHLEARNATIYAPIVGGNAGSITGDVYIRGVGDSATGHFNPGVQYPMKVTGKLTMLNVRGGGSIRVLDVGNPYTYYPGHDETDPLPAVSGQQALVVDDTVTSVLIGGNAYGDIVNISSGASASPPVPVTVNSHIGSIRGNIALTYSPGYASGALTVDAAKGRTDSIQVAQMNVGGPAPGCFEGGCVIDLMMTSLPVGAWTPQTLIRVDRGFSTLGTAASMFGLIPSSVLVNYSISTGINADGSVSAILNGFDIDFTRATDPGSNLESVAQLANSQVAAIQKGTADASTNPALYRLLLASVQVGAPNYVQQYLGQIDPSQHFGASSAASEATQVSAAALHSCGGSAGVVADSISQGSCIWAKYGGHDSRRQNVSHKYRSRSLAFGRQWAVSEDLFFGLAANYADTDMSGAASFATGDRLGVGAVLKMVKGERFGSLALTASRDSIDGERQIVTTPSTLRATMAQKVDVLGAHLRLGQRLVNGRFDLTARADFSAAAVRDHGYTERGGGAYNLRVDRETSAVFEVQPVLQAGVKLSLGAIPLRLYGEVGQRWRFGDLKTHAALTSGFDSAYRANIVHERDETVMTYGLGLNTELNDRVELRLNYGRSDGASFESDEFGVKAALRF